ncbi:MAG: hypothetical protein JSR30_00120 [Proteobacteria bacterium]|nr:hypothetical protein [Pseudomonadota bacterium]
MNTRSHRLSLQFSVGTVDSASGILRGVTVAKSGVQAQGHFVLVDKGGKLTKDPKQAVNKLPVFTDEETLTTLMAAVTAAGGRVKSRSDHDDNLNKRAGSAVRFVRDGDRVACDLQLLQSYKDRAIVLETAKETPELIGCSIDFKPRYEVIDGKAFIRVQELYAVDIVDEGAITPQGMFMRAGVDKDADDETAAINSPTHMATSPSIEDCMKALSALTETVTGLNAAVAKLSAPVVDKDKDGMAAVKELQTQLAALKTSQETFITEQKAELAKIAKEKASLGLSAEKITALSTLAEQTERERLEAEKSGAEKNYLQLVDAHVESTKCKRSDAHTHVQRTKPDAYRAHLAAKGTVKNAA